MMGRIIEFTTEAIIRIEVDKEAVGRGQSKLTLKIDVPAITLSRSWVVENSTLEEAEK